MRKLILIAVMCAAGCQAADVVLGRLSDLTFTAGAGANRLAQWAVWSPLSLSPVAWYRGDGNALDSSGNGRNGTWDTSASYTNGVNAQAFDFKAVGSVACPTNSFSDGDFSVSLWAFCRSGSGNRGVFCSRGYWNITGQWLFYDISAVVAGNVSWRSDTFGLYLNVPNVYDAWTHWALVRSGDVFQIWRNGTIAGASTNAISMSNARPFRIGARTSSVDVLEQQFAGAIDDVLPFDRALTPAEITQLYQYRQ